MPSELKRREEEAARKRLEEKAKGMPRRGTVVEIVGLQNRADLNGSIGYYMGVALNSEDRYIIKLFTRTEVSLKKEIFASTTYTGSRPSPSSKSQACPLGKPASVQPQRPVTAPHNKQPSNGTNGSIRSARDNETYILSCQLNKFIGNRGAHHKDLVSKTHTHIHVIKEKPLQANGREWLLVQVSGDKKNTKNALAIIDEWVEQHDPDRTPCEPDSAATISTTPPTTPHSTTDSSTKPKDSPKTGQENRPSSLDNRNGKMPPKPAPKPPQFPPTGPPSEATLQRDITPPDDHQGRKTVHLASAERLAAPRAAAPLDLLTFWRVNLPPSNAHPKSSANIFLRKTLKLYWI